MFQSLTLASVLVAAVTTLQSPQSMPGNERGVEYMTRAETVMSLVLARTPDVPVVRNTGKFSDIPKGSWFEPYMLYAEKMGIIRADKTQLLHPESSVTRAEFLKMLTVTFGLPFNYPHRYSDVPETAWFDLYAGLAQHYRLFNLEDTGKLEPQRILTRNEALRAFKTFQRVYERNQENPQLEQDLARQQAQGKLKIYTVISTRQQNVTLIDPAPEPERKPLVRRTAIPLSLPEIRTEILAMVNAIRTKEKLEPLTYSTSLEESAQAYAEKMSSEGFFSHTAPNGETLRERIARTSFYDRSFSKDCLCVKGYAMGENLAIGQKTAKEAVDAWMKSPAHRDAILNPDYTHLGIGVKSGLWVQHFGGILLPGQAIHSAPTEEH